MSQPEIPEELAEQAIRWFARLRADDVGADDRYRFFEWLKRGRMEQRAFVEILELWEGVSVVADMEFEELQPFPPLSAFKRKVEGART
ncbi:MAG: FecR/PupR family sigma factor regulator [Pseudomonadales bacterium]